MPTYRHKPTRPVTLWFSVLGAFIVFILAPWGVGAAFGNSGPNAQAEPLVISEATSDFEYPVLGYRDQEVYCEKASMLTSILPDSWDCGSDNQVTVSTTVFPTESIEDRSNTAWRMFDLATGGFSEPSDARFEDYGDRALFNTFDYATSVIMADKEVDGNAVTVVVIITAFDGGDSEYLGLVDDVWAALTDDERAPIVMEKAPRNGSDSAHEEVRV